MSDDYLLILPPYLRASGEQFEEQREIMARALSGDEKLAAVFGTVRPGKTAVSASDLYGISKGVPQNASAEEQGSAGLRVFSRKDLYTAGVSLFLRKDQPALLRKSAIQELGLPEAEAIFDPLTHWTAKALYRGYHIGDLCDAVFEFDGKPPAFRPFRYYFTFGRMMKSCIQEFGFSLPLETVQVPGKEIPSPWPGISMEIAGRMQNTLAAAAQSGHGANPFFRKIFPRKAAIAEKLGEKYLYLPGKFSDRLTFYGSME